jgi:hypothetical protein
MQARGRQMGKTIGVETPAFAANGAMRRSKGEIEKLSVG